MNVPARKPDTPPKCASNLPSLIAAPPEKARIPTLDAHEFFTGSVADLDSWSLPGLLVTALAAVLLGASTYVALIAKHVDVPAPVAIPVASAPKADAVQAENPAAAQTEKTLANFAQGLTQLGALFPDAHLTVAQKGHKGVVIGVSESFFFSGSHVQIEAKSRTLFASLRDLALASGLRFNVAVETSAVMTSETAPSRSDYLLKAKRAFSFAQAISGESFLQKRVRTTIQSGSSPLANPRVSLRLAVSQNP